MPHEVMLEFADFYSDTLFTEVAEEYTALRAAGFEAYLRARQSEAEAQLREAKEQYSAHHTQVEDALGAKQALTQQVSAVLEALNKNRSSCEVRRHHLVLLDTVEDIDDTIKQEGTFWYCRCRMLQDEIAWIDYLLKHKAAVVKKGALRETSTDSIVKKLKGTEVGSHLLLFRDYISKLEGALEAELDNKTEEKLKKQLLKILHVSPAEFENATLKEQYNFILRFYERLLEMQEKDLKKAKDATEFALSVSLMAVIGKELDMLEYTLTLAIEAIG
ncbi:MAG: hypothetical protein ABH829_01440 [archaeon]